MSQCGNPYIRFVLQSGNPAFQYVCSVLKSVCTFLSEVQAMCKEMGHILQ
uniref:Uncharacterized protein n=1 Tax=Anguilla anguilla TaxID=7936 RepID=A0A0E9U4G2_ANGAN